MIIFMMVILATLGAFAIASANTNFKLSQRYLEWNVMYFSLDERGEEYLFQLDGKLAEAEAKALGYLENKSYQTESQMEIAETIRTEINDRYREKDSIGFLEDAFNMVYMVYVSEYIKELSAFYPETEMLFEEKDGFISGILTSADIKSDKSGYELCGLRITVSVEPVKIDADLSGRIFVARAQNATRYAIIEWYEYQTPNQN